MNTRETKPFHDSVGKYKVQEEKYVFTGDRIHQG
jgi:hypothetical protein